MPYSCRIDTTAKIAFVIAEDPLDRDSSVREMFALAARPDFVADINLLVDTRGARYLPTVDDAYHLAEIQSRREVFGGRRIAVVTDSDAHVGLVNMVAGLMELDHTETRTFRDVEDAVLWLRHDAEPTAAQAHG